jgi:hypothetical protein
MRDFPAQSEQGDGPVTVFQEESGDGVYDIHNPKIFYPGNDEPGDGKKRKAG